MLKSSLHRFSAKIILHHPRFQRRHVISGWSPWAIVGQIRWTASCCDLGVFPFKQAPSWTPTKGIGRFRRKCHCWKAQPWKHTGRHRNHVTVWSPVGCLTEIQGSYHSALFIHYRIRSLWVKFSHIARCLTIDSKKFGYSSISQSLLTAMLHLSFTETNWSEVEITN